MMPQTQDLGRALGVELTRATPPIAATTAMLFGLRLPDIVSIATLLFIGLQAAFLIWKWRRADRSKEVEP